MAPRTQLGVLTELFCGRNDDLMISELAERLGLPLSSVAREVHRLEQADVVRIRKRGRAQFVSPNRSLPLAGPLTDLLDRTTGPAAAIADAFSSVKDVQAVWIFGSWAARQRGVPGAAPHDIDLAVIGTPSALAVSRAAHTAERWTHDVVADIVATSSSCPGTGPPFRPRIASASPSSDETTPT